jgi:hypothetical protein
MTEQGTLFNLTEVYDRDTTKPAQARNAIGECAQNFVVEFLGLKEVRIDGRMPVCPDFSFGSAQGEIKSIGKNKRALIYKWRIEKEITFADGGEFYYIFANHDCLISVESGSAIVNHFKTKPPILYILSLSDVYELVAAKKIRKFSLFEGGKDSRVGYNRAGYIEGGWQFSLTEFTFNSCILVESYYCSQSAMTRIYYTDSSRSFVERLQPVAKLL